MSPIEFRCCCGKTIRAPEKLAGKRGKCPSCGAIQVVPTSQVAASMPHGDANAPESQENPGESSLFGSSKWTCRKCGSTSDDLEVFCHRCGLDRMGVQPVTPVPRHVASGFDAMGVGVGVRGGDGVNRVAGGQPSVRLMGIGEVSVRGVFAAGFGWTPEIGQMFQVVNQLVPGIVEVIRSRLRDSGTGSVADGRSAVGMAGDLAADPMFSKCAVLQGTMRVAGRDLFLVMLVEGANTAGKAVLLKDFESWSTTLSVK